MWRTFVAAVEMHGVSHHLYTLILKAEIAPTGSDTDKRHIIHFIGTCAFGHSMQTQEYLQLTRKTYVHPGLLHVLC